MTRRSRGSGSIRKRGQSLYLRYRPPGQARQVEHVLSRFDGESMTAYRKRAHAELARIMASLTAGVRVAPTPRTFEELAEANVTVSSSSGIPVTPLKKLLLLMSVAIISVAPALAGSRQGLWQRFRRAL